MLLNLKAEMVRRGIKVKELADLLNVRIATIYDKLNGHYDFSLSEALKIKKHYFPTKDFEYLFERDRSDVEDKKEGVR